MKFVCIQRRTIRTTHRSCFGMNQIHHRAACYSGSGNAVAVAVAENNHSVWQQHSSSSKLTNHSLTTICSTVIFYLAQINNMKTKRIDTFFTSKKKDTPNGNGNQKKKANNDSPIKASCGEMKKATGLTAATKRVGLTAAKAAKKSAPNGVKVRMPQGTSIQKSSGSGDSTYCLQM